jgi:hypothetical protein
MPFEGQLAGKIGHEDILQNPDVEGFLLDHRDVPRPDVATMEGTFAACPRASAFTGKLPAYIIATDGSYYEAAADQREPSRRVGYVKVGMVALDMNAYEKLGAGSIYVDPIAVNRLLNSDALSMALPGAHMKRPEFLTAAEGYRAYVQRYYDGARTILPSSKETLLDTLVALLSYLGDIVAHNGKECVRVKGCPNAECPTNEAAADGSRPPSIDYFVPVEERETLCDRCGGRIFIVDAIRIGEAFVDSGSNAETYGRTMLASEHILVAHWIRTYRDHNLQLLSKVGFVMDGPLSISGESARLHAAMLLLIHEANAELAKHGMSPLMVMGLTKTGMTVEHFANLNWPMPGEPGASDMRDFAFAITDDYRYQFITPRPRTTGKPFGSETYYGQDIFIRTARGHEFVVTLPYPTRSKSDAAFKTDRFDVTKYVTAGIAFELIRTLESDLYSNSLVPVILAHEYASISLVPGGKVLDLATARAVGAV